MCSWNVSDPRTQMYSHFVASLMSLNQEHTPFLCMLDVPLDKESPNLSTIGQNTLDTSNSDSQEQMCICPSHILRIPIIQAAKSLQPNCHYPECGMQSLLTHPPLLFPNKHQRASQFSNCPGLFGEAVASCLATRAYKLVSTGFAYGAHIVNYFPSLWSDTKMI